MNEPPDDYEFQEGHTAYFRGIARWGNPYLKDSWRWRGWDNGWTAADEQNDREFIEGP